MLNAEQLRVNGVKRKGVGNGKVGAENRLYTHSHYTSKRAIADNYSSSTGENNGMPYGNASPN
jgi:hypothetical protein